MSTTDCDQLDSLTLSTDDSSKNNDHNHIATSNDVLDGREVLLTVPSTFAEFPLGFALDAGGSVTKLVYRSKLDYTDGRPTHGEHVLRLRFIPNGNGDDLLTFLKDNCDVRVTSDSETTNGERPMFYQTGVGLQHFVKKLEETFNCRIKVKQEMDASFTGILSVTRTIPELKQTIPFSVESTEAALSSARLFMNMMMNCRKEGIDAFGEAPTQRSDVDVPAFCMKLMTVDPATFAEELTAVPITFPCAFVQCGSATGCAILHENGRQQMGDFKPTAGKTILALARLLTGTNSFRELLELASTGDSRKVDLLTGDLKNKSYQEKDWYSMMPDSFPVFTLGKAAEKRFDGTYTKADIAAGLIYMQCKELAHFGINVARRCHVTSVVYAGSFVDWPLTQKILQECFLSGTIHLPLIGESDIRMHILPHCGFLAALGIWHENNKVTEPLGVIKPQE